LSNSVRDGLSCQSEWGLNLVALVSPRPPVEPMEERKLCPLPVASFTGRKEILDKMRRYFDSDGKLQRVFVLYGLGGSGKSQIAFKFLQESQDDNRYDGSMNIQDCRDDLLLISSASPTSSTLTLPTSRHSKWIFWLSPLGMSTSQ